MTGDTQLKLQQRADYTHKYNLRTGRHGWLRLTPAYSVKIVEELIETCNTPMRVLDPFCGTATTALSALYHGHLATTTDINPFLVWLGNAKIAHYSYETIRTSQIASTLALDLVTHDKVIAAPPPPIHNIERWWTAGALDFLCHLRTAIDEVTEAGSQQRTLLYVAFCRTLIALSNAAFNHQSMSFKSNEHLLLPFNADMKEQYADDVRFVLSGAAENPVGSGKIILGDARNLLALEDNLFDLVITSPPYANRMSYIRELRPYMYWLDFLVNAREAGEIDWLSIGGTWGIATSRLSEWTPDAGYFKHDLLDATLSEIAGRDNKNGVLLARYVEKYVVDMWSHFQSLRSVLAENAEIHYIVGNSTFYGVLVPVEQIYTAMLTSLGFGSVKYRPIRKRNSKKELVEFDVSAIWKP